MPLPTGDLLTETFDNTTDYDNAGWSVQGSVNPNYTGTVLEGTQSLLLDGNSGFSAINHTFTSQTTVYVYFQWRTAATLSGFNLIFKLADASETECARIFVKDDPAFYFDSNGVFSGPIATIAPNTTYHLWLSYVKGTGANAVVTLGVSTTGIRPTSGSNYGSITNGAGTVNAEWVRFIGAGASGWSCIFDRLAVNTTQIGDAVPDVSVNLTGVAASPAIGTGTVTITSPVAPPDQGLVAGGGHWYGLPEDEKVYLTGVAANPQIGQILALGDIREVYEKYTSPIPRTKTQKQPEMPAGMRGLFKKVEKPIPPAVFVYQVGLPKLKSAVGTGKVTAHYEEIDEETIMMIDLL